MEPESSLPHSQEPATRPYPETASSSPYTSHPTSWRYASAYVSIYFLKSLVETNSHSFL